MVKLVTYVIFSFHGSLLFIFSMLEISLYTSIIHLHWSCKRTYLILDVLSLNCGCFTDSLFQAFRVCATKPTVDADECMNRCVLDMHTSMLHMLHDARIPCPASRDVPLATLTRRCSPNAGRKIIEDILALTKHSEYISHSTNLSYFFDLLPRKLTCHLKRGHFKRKVVFQALLSNSLPSTIF